MIHLTKEQAWVCMYTFPEEAYQYFLLHQHYLTELYGKGHHVVCSKNGVLFDSPKASTCMDWVLEHSDNDKVVVRPVDFDPYKIYCDEPTLGELIEEHGIETVRKAATTSNFVQTSFKPLGKRWKGK